MIVKFLAIAHMRGRTKLAIYKKAIFQTRNNITLLVASVTELPKSLYRAIKQLVQKLRTLTSNKPSSRESNWLTFSKGRNNGTNQVDFYSI